MDCYAVTHPGVESLTARELVTLGASPGPTEPGGVPFTADARLLQAANLRLRTASRILVRLASFHARGFPELERHARRIPWSEYLSAGDAVDFRVTSRKSRLYHQGAVAERLFRVAQEAAGPLREAGQSGEGDGEEGGEGQLIVVRIVRDECTVSIDSSGALLHRRGYRLATGKAPLRETLAAALLLRLEWDGSCPLFDPFCGSGTIPIEGALLARNIAPGSFRGFAFERWREFDAEAWASLRNTVAAESRPVAGVPIVGSDRDAGAVKAARANAERAGVLADLALDVASLSAAQPPGAPGLLLTNPPYGLRLGERLRLRDLYAQLGNIARRSLAGWTVALLSPHRDLERQTGLPFESLLETTTGGIPVRLVAARL